MTLYAWDPSPRPLPASAKEPGWDSGGEANAFLGREDPLSLRGWEGGGKLAA